MQRISSRGDRRAEELHGTERRPWTKQRQEESSVRPRAGGTGRRWCYQSPEDKPSDRIQSHSGAEQERWLHFGRSYPAESGLMDETQLLPGTPPVADRRTEEPSFCFPSSASASYWPNPPRRERAGESGKGSSCGTKQTKQSRDGYEHKQAQSQLRKTISRRISIMACLLGVLQTFRGGSSDSVPRFIATVLTLIKLFITSCWDSSQKSLSHCIFPSDSLIFPSRPLCCLGPMAIKKK